MANQITLNVDDISPQLRQELAPYENSPYTYDPDEEKFAKLVASTADPGHAMMQAYPTRCANDRQAVRRGTILAGTPRMAHRIAYYRRLLAMQLDISTTRVMAELAAIATADIAGIFASDGTVIHPAQIPRQLRAAIKEIDVTTKAGGETTYKYKFHDKMAALKLLASIKGMDIEARKASAPNLTFNLNVPTTVKEEDLI